MPVRIHLHTLGDALITVGEKEVRPTSPVVFAALLYLCTERGHRVPRTALQELLFPKTDERSGAHCVRQLLYKLRQLGVPLDINKTSVELPDDVVSEDFPSGRMIARDDVVLQRLASGLLPGYEPNVSAPYRQWIDGLRASHASRARKALLDAMKESHDRGDVGGMDAMSSAILRLDPLNEEATLVRAQVMAHSGEKQEAIRLLAQYSAEVGITSPHLKVQPDLLRRRIAERFHASDRAAVPMLGRQEDLAFLLAQYARAEQECGTVSIIWGEAGIGKTRLAEEFKAHLSLKNARVEWAHCQAFDKERPLGALLDLVPKLLLVRGALGVSPESLLHLKRLSGDVVTENTRDEHPDLTTARIREAVADLLSCVSAEQPLVLFVEDAHWLDEASLRLLLGLIPGQRSRLLLVITMRERPRFAEDVRLTENLVVRHLAPLGDNVAADLLLRVLGPGFDLDTSVQSQCITLTAGNPLFIRTVAEHLRLRGTAPSAQSGITDLLRQRIRTLDGPSLLLLRAIAALGNHASLDRLRSCTGLALDIELLAIQDLADRGLIQRYDDAIKCAHDILAEVVIIDSPAVVSSSLFERIAVVLEHEGLAGQQPGLLWSCAECWHRAGQRKRAFSALCRSADFALDIGQPAFAVSALEKAQELVDGVELLELLERTALVAERANDAQSVLQHATRYGDLAPRLGVPHSGAISVAVANALRGQMQPTWHLAPELFAIALNSEIAPQVRLRAARGYIISAEQELERSPAITLFEALLDTQLRAQAPAAFAHTSVLFHALIGDLSKVRAPAGEMLDHLDALDEWHQCSALAILGLAFFRAGEADQAFSFMHDALQKAERYGFAGYALSIADFLCCSCFHLGDMALADRWHNYNRDYRSKRGLPDNAGFISAELDFTLARGDTEAARGHIAALARMIPRETPYNRRFALAYQILIQAMENDVTLDDADIAELEDLYRRGLQTSEHDYCAFALASAISHRRTTNEGKALFQEYTGKWRRDRHPISPLLIGRMTSSPNGNVSTDFGRSDFPFTDK